MHLQNVLFFTSIVFIIHHFLFLYILGGLTQRYIQFTAAAHKSHCYVEIKENKDS